MKRILLTVCAAVLAACTPTGSGPGGTAAPTSTPGGIVVGIDGGLADQVVLDPTGLLCVGELQDQTLSGTTNTTFDFVRTDHVNITVTRGQYTVSFQAATGCNTDGEPLRFGPVIGPTTVRFDVTYIGAFVREENPVCIARSTIVFSSFETAAGPLLSGGAQAIAQGGIQAHLDRRLAVAMQDLLYNGDANEAVEQARCDDWEPLNPADFGL